MNRKFLTGISIGLAIVAVFAVIAAMAVVLRSGDGDIAPLIMLLGLMCTMAGALAVTVSKKRK